MEFIDLKRLDLAIEESRDTINFITQKRGISTEKLLLTIKPNLKHKNNEILTIKTRQELIKSQKSQKTQQELRKSQQELIKSQQELIKSQQNLIKSQKTQQELRKSQKNNKI